MLSVLASGTLVSDPKARTTTAGKAYATAQMRVPVEDAEALLVSVIAFHPDAVAGLLALSKGDSCAIAGRAKLSSWMRDGVQHHGLSVTADKALSVYQAGKARKAAREGEDAPSARSGAA